MNRNRLSLILATALVGSVALVGCKKKEDAAATPAPTETPAPAPAPTEPAPAPAPAAATAVGSVDLGNAIGADNKITTPGTTFAAKDTIYASISTDGGNPGKLNAKWSFQDGQVVHEEGKDVPAGPATTEFRISNPDGWPTGKYKLEVSLDGAVVQTKDFDVK